jgi:hypothetical protein
VWRRALRWGWLVLCIAVAAVLVLGTFVGSAGISCGAYDYGPNPGAEAAFCGYRSGEKQDLSTLFVLVQFIPALPVLAGGVMTSIGRSRRFVAAGIGVGIATTFVIWGLEP